MLPSRLLRALRQRSLHACIARQGCGGRGSSKQAWTPARVRAGGRAGGRTGWAQSATHHAAAPPTPVLVARRFDATVLSRSRLPGRLAGTCGVGRSHGATHALPLSSGGTLARDGANTDRPRTARVGDRQAVQLVGRALNNPSLGGARAAGLSNVRSRSGLTSAKPCGARCAVVLRGRAELSSRAVELRCRAFVLPSG